MQGNTFTGSGEEEITFGWPPFTYYMGTALSLLSFLPSKSFPPVFDTCSHVAGSKCWQKAKSITEQISITRTFKICQSGASIISSGCLCASVHWWLWFHSTCHSTGRVFACKMISSTFEGTNQWHGSLQRWPWQVWGPVTGCQDLNFTRPLFPWEGKLWQLLLCVFLYFCSRKERPEYAASSYVLQLSWELKSGVWTGNWNAVGGL